MKKRFTDSEKWHKPWFRKLKPEHKLFWSYLVDNCDNAGVWEVDWELVSFMIGIELNENDILEIFKKQISIFDNGRRWYIKDFIEFQYGCKRSELNPKSNLHISAIRLVKKHKIESIERLDESINEGIESIEPILPMDNSIGNIIGNGKDIGKSKKELPKKIIIEPSEQLFEMLAEIDKELCKLEYEQKQELKFILKKGIAVYTIQEILNGYENLQNYENAKKLNYNNIWWYVSWKDKGRCFVANIKKCKDMKGNKNGKTKRDNYGDESPFPVETYSGD